ncbi:rho GTPase-activating protein 39 isoform X2 [Alosa sapidissima]|uniref:rho GTPase-activating protein 39 isoform X2 n=2 Tax=Alosa sapidissima TaxID=34773 RepID=UPI001C094435|nr:rho GTPase-activating protein 39 isoform X2 [Alosa sapidissima]
MLSSFSSDWVEILEPRSRERMYVNLTTGECGWEPPAGMPVRQSDGNQWWELFDSANSRFYYYNCTSQQTVWHRPTACDIVPLAQLQAMKRSSESELRGIGRPQRGSGEGRRTPLLGLSPVPPPQELDNVSGRETPSTGRGDSLDGRREAVRDPAQRWQPAPGSKAAMLVKVNNTGRNQSPGPSSALQLLHFGSNSSSGSSSAIKPLYPAHIDRTGPFGAKMAVPGDLKQAYHLKKSDGGSFGLIMPNVSTPAFQNPQRSQAGTPRPSSPQYGTTAPIYDEPPMDPPIYDEPPMEMEVEGAHLLNRPSPLPYSPSHSLPRLGQPKLLQYPASHMGAKHRRSPSATEYSPAGRECIKHMVNVDPAASTKPGLILTHPQALPSAPESTSVAGAMQSQAQLQMHQHQQQQQPLSPVQAQKGGSVGGGPQREVSLEKKQSWRLLEAGVLKSMEARHSRQSSLASQQEYPGPAAITYQDSGYSTGPSPSLRRKNRRRPPGAGAGAGLAGAAAAAAAAGQGRPGSVGSTGELNALNEKLMAEMRAVVSRSNTIHGSKASLDTEIGSETGSAPRARTPLDSLHKYGGGGGGSREDMSASNRSLYRAAGGSHAELPLSPLAAEGGGRQKRTYEKVDSLEKSITSQTSLSSPEPPRTPSQTGTLESKGQLEISPQGGGSGHGVGTGGTPAGSANDGFGQDGTGTGNSGNNNNDVSGGCGGQLVGSGGGGGYQYPYTTLCKPSPDANMVDWASKNLNLHTQGLFRRRVSIANMLSWNRGSIKKPMLITSDRAVKKEACEMFKLVQAYMGDRPARIDRRHAALLVVTKCWGTQGLRDELYVQLVRQTTGNLSLRSLASGWELMAISLAFFSPSPKFRRYLEGYIQRHMEPSNDKKILQQIQEQQDMKNKKNSKSRKKRKQNNEEEEEQGLPISTYAKYCYRKLQKVAVTGGKKGLRKPTLEEIDHSRNAIVTPSLFGSALEEIMERQSQLFPERRLPWVQVQLSQYVLALGGAQTEGIFRVPGDIDEVNALKLQVDQWKIPENLSDPNVPASLLKLWYRELEEPVIPQSFYKQCITNYEDPEAAISVVQSLPELSRLVLCYFINFLQVFAQPVNVSKTKMDVNNLAMVMAPNCLRCQSDDPRIIFENTRKEMSFLRVLIVHLDTSFIKGII